jgi:23S rRNA (pseudouridine1915-N3)-methyltransferase
MKVALLQTGKTSEKYIAEGVNIYSERISKYAPFEILTIPDLRNTRGMSAGEQKSREGEKMLGFFRDDDYIVILDDKGKEYTTLEFSSFLEKTFMLPKKRIVFVAGGPWGISDDAMGRADVRLSLSKLTFSHQLVRLLFMEQLYRAFTVIRGEPYHHE